MLKNKPIHITYIGRLEKEKGIELVLAAIQKSQGENKNIVWHICGDGSYMSTFRELEKYEKSYIRIYGHIDRQKIDEVLKNTDLVLMPSLFLETFGLVALDTLTRGVPVCGFSRGGLTDLVHPSLTIDPIDPIGSLFRILDVCNFPLLDVSGFSYDIWIERLTELTTGLDRILLVSDYTNIVGGAEQYLSDLALALRSIGKEVEIYGYAGGLSPWMRIWLMFLSPIAFWRGALLSQKIKQYQPDLIWMHGVLRYIGPYGVRVVSQFTGCRYMTHHDLGLISPYPSRIYGESGIPVSPSLGHWIARGSLSIFAIFSIVGKWTTISAIWYYLNSQHTTHLLPSGWMQSHFAKYATTVPIVFPHTSQKTGPVKP